MAPGCRTLSVQARASGSFSAILHRPGEPQWASGLFPTPFGGKAVVVTGSGPELNPQALCWPVVPLGTLHSSVEEGSLGGMGRSRLIILSFMGPVAQPCPPRRAGMCFCHCGGLVSAKGRRLVLGTGLPVLDSPGWAHKVFFFKRQGLTVLVA